MSAAVNAPPAEDRDRERAEIVRTYELERNERVLVALSHRLLDARQLHDEERLPNERLAQDRRRRDDAGRGLEATNELLSCFVRARLQQAAHFAGQ